MKKTIAALITVLLFLQCMTACGGTENPPTPADYSIYVYQNAGDTLTPQYTGEKFDTLTRTSKAALTVRQTVIDGQGVNLYYEETRKTSFYKDARDVFSATYNGNLLLIEYNERTGKIARYERYSECTDRDYVSDVNPQSDEGAFVSYAKGLLLDLTGVSVEGREMSIATKIIKEDGSAEYDTRFVNNSASDENFRAEYTFFFRAYIDGIARADDVSITVTNVGELCSLTALAYDEAYRRFEDITIDEVLVRSKVEQAFSSVQETHNVDTYTVELRCLPLDSDLWVEARVEYSYRDADPTVVSGIVYLIKVAQG